jgi:hypothetical protein
MSHIQSDRRMRQPIDIFNSDYRKGFSQALLKQRAGPQLRVVMDIGGNSDEPYSISDFQRFLRLLRQRFPSGGIVPSARLNLVVLLALDFQFAVAAVEFGIDGRVSQVVLAAQFRRNLVEGLS